MTRVDSGLDCRSCNKSFPRLSLHALFGQEGGGGGYMFLFILNNSHKVCIYVAYGNMTDVY